MASRYSGIQTLISPEGKRYFATTRSQPISFYQQFSPTIIKVIETDRLDQLAFDYYDGHGELWWIIAAANGFDLPTDLIVGNKLVIPTDYKSLLQALDNLNKPQ